MVRTDVKGNVCMLLLRRIASSKKNIPNSRLERKTVAYLRPNLPNRYLISEQNDQKNMLFGAAHMKPIQGRNRWRSTPGSCSLQLLNGFSMQYLRWKINRWLMFENVFLVYSDTRTDLARVEFTVSVVKRIP